MTNNYISNGILNSVSLFVPKTNSIRTVRILFFFISLTGWMTAGHIPWLYAACMIRFIPSGLYTTANLPFCFSSPETAAKSSSMVRCVSCLAASMYFDSLCSCGLGLLKYGGLQMIRSKRSCTKSCTLPVYSSASRPLRSMFMRAASVISGKRSIPQTDAGFC